MVAPLIVRLDPFAAEPRLLTVKQIARALSCTQTHVGNLIEGGKLAAFNFAGNKATRALYRIHPAALQKFLQEAVIA